MTDFLRTHAVPAAKVHVFRGLAHECLQHAAAEHAADFLVMGAVARRGLAGSSSAALRMRVLDRLPCDLIVIKPVGFQAPRGD